MADDDKIHEYIKLKYPTKYATYSLYEDNTDTLKHPDSVFIEGKVFIYQKADNIFTNIPYCSKIINKPTYGDILQLCDDMIIHIEDYHHHFLEDISIVKQISEDTYELEVFLGS